MRWCKFLALIVLLVVPSEGLPEVIVEIPGPSGISGQGVVLPAGNIPAQSFSVDKEYRIDSLEGWFQYLDTPNATAILYTNDTSSGKSLPGTQFFASDPFNLPTVSGSGPNNGFFGISGLDVELDPGIYWLAFTSTSSVGEPGQPTIMMPFASTSYPYNGAVFYSSLGYWISPGETHFGIRVQGTPVPEPSTMLLLGSGLVGLVGFSRRRLKRMKTMLACLFGMGFLITIALPSQAAPVTFEFTGILPTVSQGLDPAFSSVFSGGETVTATYTFDSELVNLVPGTNEGFYRPLSAFQIQIAELSWDFGGDINSYVYVRNRFESVGGSGMDWYWVGSSDSILGPTIAGMYMQGMSVQMTTNAFDFISSDALPLTPPDLTPFLSPIGPSAYAVAKIGLTFTDGTENHYLDSSITSAQVVPVAPVPEPSTMLLLGSGLAGLVGFGRRRMKKK